jgi:hypothetical protein
VAQIIWFRVDGRWRARGFQIEGGKVAEITLEYPEPE